MKPLSVGGSNLTNKYNPQEPWHKAKDLCGSSNLTNKYNPQELFERQFNAGRSSNLTNKYNPQEQAQLAALEAPVQILPINTILKNAFLRR